MSEENFDKVEEVTQEILDLITEEHGIDEMDAIMSIIASTFLSVVYSVYKDEKSLSYICKVFADTLHKTITSRESQDYLDDKTVH